MYFKVLFMNDQEHSLETLQDIKRMMERSSRFISLSGLSGISAGICAIAGAVAAYPYAMGRKAGRPELPAHPSAIGDELAVIIRSPLFMIAALTFTAALLFAFLFTYLKSKREAIPVWGVTAKRLMLSVSIPIAAGGIFLLKLMETGTYSLVAPGCLLFYGLALINASRYTLTEIKFLGYSELLLALISLWFAGYGLYFWAFGFGILHIVYGAFMWLKYERA